MIKLTQALKAFLVAEYGVKADATDAEFRQACLKALMDGTKLTDAKYAELTVDPAAAEGNEFEKKLDGTLTGINSLTAILTKAMGAAPVAGDKPGEKAGVVEGQAAIAGAGAIAGSGAGAGDGVKTSYLEKIFAGSDGIGTQNDPVVQVRVKGAHERFDSTRKEKRFPDVTNKGSRHPFAGERAFIGGTEGSRFVDDPSQLDKATFGAFFKLQMQHIPNLPGKAKLNQQDKELIAYALEKMDWSGTIGGEGDENNVLHLPTSGRKLTPSEQKAVIDDSTSGGSNAAPIFFDDMVVTTPILFGEFFPSVNVIPITRGRLINGFSMGNVTLSGGGFDGTDIPLFTTTAFIAAFNTTIFTCNGAVEVGLDFLSDSPVDVAGMMTEQYGRVLLNYLDRNIAAGDGTTQPTGITVASGTVSVAGGSAAPTVGVYEAFFFGVAKKYKQGYPSERIMFGANETTYSRVRAVPVGASDARRIFGMTHGDYMLMGHRYGISDTLANTKAFFGNMARYRMYRRLGQTVKVTTEGKTLVRQNMMLLSARSRWGGQPEDGAAFAVSSTMQA